MLYIIHDAAKLISGTRIAHRREVYEWPQNIHRASPHKGEMSIENTIER